MTSLERVMHTMKGEPTDRVPVFAVLGAYGGKLTCTDMHTLYNDPESYVKGQNAIQETFGIDMVLAPFDYSIIVEAWGGEVVYLDNQVPTMKKPAVERCGDIADILLPDPFTDGRLPYVLEAAKKLHEKYKEHVPLFAVVPGPCSLPSLISGLENWIETILFEESTAKIVLEHTGRFFSAWVKALTDCGLFQRIQRCCRSCDRS